MDRLKHRRRRRGRGARMTSAGASSESEWLVSRVLDVGEFRDCDGRPIGEGEGSKGAQAAAYHLSSGLVLTLVEDQRYSLIAP